MVPSRRWPSAVACPRLKPYRSHAPEMFGGVAAFCCAVSVAAAPNAKMTRRPDVPIRIRLLLRRRAPEGLHGGHAGFELLAVRQRDVEHQSPRFAVEQWRHGDRHAIAGLDHVRT